MLFVSQFSENARRILETAEAAMGIGTETGDITILLTATGGIRIVQNQQPDMPLAGLQECYGAHLAYRVRRQTGAVTLEARSQTCEPAQLRPALPPNYEIALEPPRQIAAPRATLTAW